MLIDILTLDDLSILKGQESLFHLLNQCHTNEGGLLLEQRLKKPFHDLNDIIAYQQAISYWYQQQTNFKWTCTNGTIIMLQQFLHSNEFTDKVSNDLTLQLNTWIKQLVQKDSIQQVHFLVEQLQLLVHDTHQLHLKFQEDATILPSYLHQDATDLAAVFEIKLFKQILSLDEKTIAPAKIALVHDVKRYGKSEIAQLIKVVARIDLLNVMSKLLQQEQWTLPQFHAQEALFIACEDLYHPLIPQAHPYDIHFDKQHQFLLLTGANMSGKSTFMRTIGVAVVLAHCGFPVPATSMNLAFINALITQIQVQDDLSKGESYFLAEVLRMKQTAERIQQQGQNLIIMDELFKGTNVHDAYDCSLAVIKGLVHKQANLVLLSTHLHELADKVADEQGIFFKYFETLIDKDNSFKFTYQLKDGVSKDRIGFSLLIQEGVIDLLK